MFEVLEHLLFSLFQVSDFGLANHADFNPSGGRFPIKWTAPEALRDNVRITLSPFVTTFVIWSSCLLMFLGKNGFQSFLNVCDFSV